jgi:hypothetical protein
VRLRRSSVAEDGRRALADPLPEGSGAGQSGVVDELRLVELLGVEADRADKQLAAALRELPEEACKRRAAVTGHRIRDARQGDPDSLFGQEQRLLPALLESPAGDQEGGARPALPSILAQTCR